MTIELSALDPSQVSSPSMFEALVGEPAQRLAIFSGIAISEFWTNHDEESSSTEVLVRLNYHVAALDHAVVHVGLATIENDETNFVFSVGSGRLEMEPGTGELILHVPLTILGEQTWIHRFSYQVVAHVRRVAARISGTIAVPREMFDLEDFPPPDVAPLFNVSANRVEQIAAPVGGFPSEKLVPVATGATGAVRCDSQNCFVDYAIDACPFNTPMRVDVRLFGPLDIVGVGAAQVAGPRPVILTNLAPDASGVDFALTRGPRVA